MGVIRTILLIAFIIVCIFLILLVLVQNEDNNGMGSPFGGGQSVAFGSRSASVLTKTTGVFVALFFVVAFFLALLNKVPSTNAGLDSAILEVEGETQNATGNSSWLDDLVDEKVQESSIEEATISESVPETNVEAEK